MDIYFLLHWETLIFQISDTELQNSSNSIQPHPKRVTSLPSYNSFVLCPSRKCINFSASWFSSRSFWWLENIRSIHLLSGSPPASVHPILLTFIQRLPTLRKVVSIIAACPFSCMRFHGDCCIIHLFLPPISQHTLPPPSLLQRLPLSIYRKQ